MACHWMSIKFNVTPIQYNDALDHSHNWISQNDKHEMPIKMLTPYKREEIRWNSSDALKKKEY